MDEPENYLSWFGGLLDGPERLHFGRKPNAQIYPIRTSDCTGTILAGWYVQIKNRKTRRCRSGTGSRDPIFHSASATEGSGTLARSIAHFGDLQLLLGRRVTDSHVGRSDGPESAGVSRRVRHMARRSGLERASIRTGKSSRGREMIVARRQTRKGYVVSRRDNQAMPFMVARAAGLPGPFWRAIAARRR